MSHKPMRPFFSYYGAKWTMAKHYGPPRHDRVVEPFAGSACYSTYWGVQNAELWDASEDICALWDFLINCSAEDIWRIPDTFEDYESVSRLERGAQLLVRFWIAKGRAEPSQALSPWYISYRGSQDCRVWGPAVKARIILQKPAIAAWKVHHGSYECSDTSRAAHWHVDPPYDNVAGSRYPHSDLDYQSLSQWCRTLRGHVDVCENVGADWLPFSPLGSVVTSRGRRSGARSFEAVCTLEGGHPMTTTHKNRASACRAGASAEERAGFVFPTAPVPATAFGSLDRGQGARSPRTHTARGNSFPPAPTPPALGQSRAGGF